MIYIYVICTYIHIHMPYAFVRSFLFRCCLGIGGLKPGGAGTSLTVADKDCLYAQASCRQSKGEAVKGQCRNLIEKPWPYDPNILGSILRGLTRTQAFLIRFLH